jgi:hypothetical protein
MNRDAIGTTTLDPSDDRARDAGSISDLRLRHAAAQTKRPHPEPEPNDIHHPRMSMVASLRLSGHRRSAAICGSV